MSFLDEQKREIMSAQYKGCCKHALLEGILFAKATVKDGAVVCSLESKEVFNYASALIKELFMKDIKPQKAETGGRRYIFSFSSPSAIRYLDSIAGNNIFFSEKCPLCKSSFLRGVFLSSGRITNPKKQYRLELAPSERIDKLFEFLSGCGMSFLRTKRRSEDIIYTSNSNLLEDFFATIGLNSLTFLLINSKIENEFKNTANRIRNCETNNIDKTISASLKWVNAIEALEKANLLSTLPEELEKTARLRLEYKDYSLARLAAEFSPPISKPGLSHRLNKILEIYENLLKNN